MWVLLWGVTGARTIERVGIAPLSTDDFADLLLRGLDVADFHAAADRALERLVPYDSSCWLGLDPATLLPTSHFTRESLADQLLAIAENEFLEDDVNKFADLARATRPVATLWEATRGRPETSRRHREILSPLGYADGDELRAVLREDGVAWGCVVLHRRTGPFSSREIDAVAHVADHCLGEGLHRAVLTTALRSQGSTDLPGFLVVGPDDRVEQTSPAARTLLPELVDNTPESPRLPLVLTTLVARVRGHASDAAEASIRLPRRSGGWTVLYGSVLGTPDDRRVGIMAVPEAAPQVPASLAEAYGLTPREREVMGEVMQGRSTREIAERLRVTEYTVQDHLKKVFAKAGVRSRRELVTKVFGEHYAPRLL